MDFKAFVGIDISKTTIDVNIYGSPTCREFKNTDTGFKEMIAWIERQSRAAISECLVCFEHTGLYSVQLTIRLSQKKVFYSQVPALEIKRSLGIARGKNDRVDSMRIARFAYERRDKLKCSKLPGKSLRKLQPLLSLRNYLMRQKAGLQGLRKEQGTVFKGAGYRSLFKVHDRLISDLRKKILSLEEEMRAVVENDPELMGHYKLVTSVTGIGPLTAYHMLLYTDNFERFSCWRKFACYSGTAPFEYSSGTSIRGRTKVHYFANRTMKTLLFLCAMNAIKYDHEIHGYYERRIKEGKSKMSTINIVKNKLIARVFAAVKRNSPYLAAA